jgi:hypothetical protein
MACSITPQAWFILRENSIDGLMMDTTWPIMRHSVTVVLLAMYQNVGISLAITFGASEIHQLYKQFHVAFPQLFHIDLSIDQLESDHGSSLLSLGQRDRRCLISTDGHLGILGNSRLFVAG